MKALVYHSPGLVSLDDVPYPVAGADEVIVQVAAVGICGSDMHAYHGYDERRPPPLVLGHEAAGWVAEGPRKGERVTINPLVTCGSCSMCLNSRSHLCARREIISMPPRPGAFAEFVRIPERNLYSIPTDMPFWCAALAEPLAVAWHAVRLGIQLLTDALPVVRCCVLGGGAIGVGAALTLHRFGAQQIYFGELNPARRLAAAQLPVIPYEPGTHAEPPAASVDIVIDAVGASATRQAACRMTKAGGVIIHVGLLPGEAGLDVRRITLQEITFRGTYCYTTSDFQNVLTTLAAGGFGTLDWVAKMPLKDGARAFAALDKFESAAAKIVLTL